MTADLLERTLHTTRQVLAEMKMRFRDVNRLLLVGGSTRMPIVASRLQAMTGLTPERSVNPDEAVARGAALYARYLLAKEAAAAGAGKPDTGFTVTNVNAHSLGIEGIDPATLRKTNVKLIPRNTPLPAAFTEKFITRSENQRSIVIQILQGENTLPEECTPIGRTAVENLPEGLPQGWPVEVTFEYESNGRLTVRAVVPGTHRETTLKLERTTGLSSEGLGHWREVVESAAGFDAFEALIQEALEEQITPLAPAAVASPATASQPATPGGSRPMRSAPMAPMAPLVPERLPPASAGLDGNGGARAPVHPAPRESHPTMPGTGDRPSRSQPSRSRRPPTTAPRRAARPARGDGCRSCCFTSRRPRRFGAGLLRAVPMASGAVSATMVGSRQPRGVPPRRLLPPPSNGRAPNRPTTTTTIAMDEPTIGIDLGTTFSVVARLDADGHPETLVNAEGDRLTPSVVLFDGDDVVVGKEALKAIGHRNGTRRRVLQAGRRPPRVPQGDRRQTVSARGDRSLDPQQAPRGRDGPDRPRSPRPSSPCPPISTRSAARPRRTPATWPGWRCWTSSTSRPRRPWPSGTRRDCSTDEGRRPSRCASSSTTSAAGRST